MNQQSKNMHNTFRLSASSLALLLAMPVFAQTAPDAGQTLQQLTPPRQAPRPGTSVNIEAPKAAPTLPGGTHVVLKTVNVSGSSIFSEAELLAVLGPVTGNSYDLAGLRGLAERIGAHYHAAGYPFARAYLPAQPLQDGSLRIEVVEGRYGKVQASGEPALVAAAQGYLDALQPGAVIAGAPLERATLVLDDLPGVKIVPVVRPGQEIGRGDLDVAVERTPAISGSLGLDNHGNRYTGQYRLSGGVQIDSPFLFGDQIMARAIYSDENLWLGSVGYSLPLGTSGLRGNIGYSHTAYELGKEFKSLNATGTAAVSSLGVSYPVIRSQAANLTVLATYQYKDLNDRQGVAGSDDTKSSQSLPLSLQFDRRDRIGGGAVTYGVLTWTPGELKLGSTLESGDRTSGTNSRGSFNKLNLDVARVQALPGDFSLFGRVSAQWADKNLDSSEGFSLGGPNGVRAYPTGEANGDEGWLAQLELRYALGAFSPFVFYDAGSIRVNAKPGSITPKVTQNTRSIGGGGIGVRYQQGPFAVDASVAWQTEGGKAQSDSSDQDPRAWLALSYRF